MRVYLLKACARIVRKAKLDDRSLLQAVERAERGLIDADLGGELIKQRVARTNEGKSGGLRMLIGYRHGDKAIFLYGFAKNEKDNIKPNELEATKTLAKAWLDLSSRLTAKAIIDKQLFEVPNDDEDAGAANVDQ